MRAWLPAGCWQRQRPGGERDRASPAGPRVARECVPALDCQRLSCCSVLLALAGGVLAWCAALLWAVRRSRLQGRTWARRCSTSSCGGRGTPCGATQPGCVAHAASTHVFVRPQPQLGTAMYVVCCRAAMQACAQSALSAQVTGVDCSPTEAAQAISCSTDRSIKVARCCCAMLARSPALASHACSLGLA